MLVLLVEDDDRTAHALTDSLRLHRIKVLRAATGAEALAQMSSKVDAVLLDLGLPDGHGFDVLSQLQRAADVPVLITSARADTRTRIHCLNLGADDYLVKPFETLELLARLHATLRRRSRDTAATSGSAGSGAASQAGHDTALVVDIDRQTIQVDGQDVALTRKEFELLSLLASDPGVVFRREHLMSRVWQSNWRGCEHTLTVHVAALRSKLGSAGLIETIRGVGYRLRLPS